MKRILALLILVVFVLSVGTTVAIADDGKLSAEEYSSMKAAADFTETAIYEDLDYWSGELKEYIYNNLTEYVYNTENHNLDEHFSMNERVIIAPIDVFCSAFYNAILQAPKGLFEQYIENIIKSEGNGYNYINLGTSLRHDEDGNIILYDKDGNLFKKPDDMCIFGHKIKMPITGGFYYNYVGYVYNQDNTYTFYYAEYDYENSVYDEENDTWIEAFKDNGVAITLKQENDSIILVSNEEVDKLPEEYSKDSAAPTVIETALTGSGVIYDTEKGITITDNNNFETGSTVTAKEIKNGTAFETAKKALAGISTKYVVFDFSAIKNGKTVQPKGKVKVTINIPATLSAEDLKMFYVSDKGEKENIAIKVDKKNKTVTAELEHFSTYVLANVAASPKTGDNSNIMIWTILCLISLAGVCTIAGFKTVKANK